MENNFSKKIKYIWMIWRLITLIILIVGMIIYLFNNEEMNIRLNSAIIVAFIMLILLNIFNLIIIPYQYRRYKYTINDEEIIITKGLIFRNHIIIPIVQIQDIGYSEGPIQLLLKIASINVSTAGSNHDYNGFEKEEAIKLVERIKERVKELSLEKQNGDINE